MLKNKTIALAVPGLLLSLVAQAHPGRLDSNGGHWNKKTGQYECHKDYCVTPEQSKVPAQVKSNETFAPSNFIDEDLVSSVEPDFIVVLDSEVPSEDNLPKYNRRSWPHWVDMDGDCQDTRAEALIIAANNDVQFKTGKHCEVVTGHFYGQYTNTHMSEDGEMDIDHVIPLKEAHLTGGYKWSKSLKKQFANDPLNVIAVDLSANRSKGDKYPKKWMPPYEIYHCEYLTRWLQVKEKYGLLIRKSTTEMYVKACETEK